MWQDRYPFPARFTIFSLLIGRPPVVARDNIGRAKPFDFVPDILMFFESNGIIYMGYGAPLIGNPNKLTSAYNENALFASFNVQYNYRVAAKRVNNTIWWYQEAGSIYQLNDSGITYTYVALG